MIIIHYLPYVTVSYCTVIHLAVVTVLPYLPSVMCLTFLYSTCQISFQIKENCCTNIDALTAGQMIGVRIDSDSTLHLVINGSDRGAIVRELPSVCYAVVDLYGQCEQVTVVECDRDIPSSLPLPSSEDKEKADKEDGKDSKDCPI